MDPGCRGSRVLVNGQAPRMNARTANIGFIIQRRMNQEGRKGKRSFRLRRARVRQNGELLFDIIWDRSSPRLRRGKKRLWLKQVGPNPR